VSRKRARQSRRHRAGDVSQVRRQGNQGAKGPVAGVADTAVGKEVDVVIIRKGEEKTRKVTLGRLEDNDKPQPAAIKTPEPAEKRDARALALIWPTFEQGFAQRYKIQDSLGRHITNVDWHFRRRRQSGSPRRGHRRVRRSGEQRPPTSKGVDQLKKDGKKSVLLLCRNARANCAVWR